MAKQSLETKEQPLSLLLSLSLWDKKEDMIIGNKMIIYFVLQNTIRPFKITKYLFQT